MTKHIGWEFYRSFLAVLQTGSLSAAARALGTTQPTVGRHIAALEKSLKLTLFTRSQVGLLPTEASEALRGYAEEMANAAAVLERAATNQGEGIRGTVRVTASEVIGVEVLPSIIVKLRTKHPELKLELVLSNRPQDLLHREADIAVRMFQPKQTQLVVRRIGQIELGLHASKAYIESNGSPGHMQSLKHYSLVGFDKPNDFIRQVTKMLPPGFEREHFAFSCDSDLAQLALIRAGAGIGVCQVRLAERDNRLVRVLSDEFSLQLETWITMHENLRNNPPCRAVFDSLVEGFRQYLE